MRRIIASATVPLPPSVNHAYGVSARGERRLYATDALSDWKNDAYLAWLASGGRPEQTPPPRQRWGWHGRFYFADRRRDMDNACKFVQDLAAMMCHLDDRYCDECRQERRIDRSDPRVEVTVYLMEET